MPRQDIGVMRLIENSLEGFKEQQLKNNIEHEQRATNHCGA